MNPASLEAVLNHPAIWRGHDCARVKVPSVPTGFTELDVLLPGEGWPGDALTEIYAEHRGIGELQLVMPAVARLTHAERWVAMIAPPCLPYAPALVAHGVRLPHLMLIRTQTAEDRLWTAEQALRSGSCGAILLWLDHVSENALRRMQIAAEGSGAIVLLFRAIRTRPFSAATLRLYLGKEKSRTVVRILKRRGGGIPAPVALDLHGAAAGRYGALLHPAQIFRNHASAR